MDNDTLRRGKLSVHKKFNEFTAILAGNSLLILAFEILSGRELNDSMAEYVCIRIEKKFFENNIKIDKAAILLLGITFKENCTDSRNSKLIDIYNILKNKKSCFRATTNVIKLLIMQSYDDPSISSRVNSAQKK